MAMPPYGCRRGQPALSSAHTKGPQRRADGSAQHREDHMQKLAGLILAVVVLVFANAVSAATETVVHSFDDAVDGYAPSQLLAGDSGNLYVRARRRAASCSSAAPSAK
jgi:hypothetical protein